jgi:hypothetical protein
MRVGKWALNMVVNARDRHLIGTAESSENMWFNQTGILDIA